MSYSNSVAFLWLEKKKCKHSRPATAKRTANTSRRVSVRLVVRKYFAGVNEPDVHRSTVTSHKCWGRSDLCGKACDSVHSCQGGETLVCEEYSSRDKPIREHGRKTLGETRGTGGAIRGGGEDGAESRVSNCP